MHLKTIGIIGCGAIGSALAEYAHKNLTSVISEIILCDSDSSKIEALTERIPNAKVVDSIEETVSKADLIIEAASPQVIPSLFKTVLDKEKDLMVMSIGGFLGNEGFLEEERKKGIRIILPSGAIAGVDALKSSRLAGIESVTLTTRKGPKSIKGAPYLLERNIDVDNIKEETVIFEGSALEAVKAFPTAGVIANLWHKVYGI